MEHATRGPRGGKGPTAPPSPVRPLAGEIGRFAGPCRVETPQLGALVADPAAVT